jgi:ParB family chromosome partitioning protein
MARKNIFEISPEPHQAEPEPRSGIADSRPLAGIEKPLKRAGAVGAFSQSLGGLGERAQRVAELEEKLAKGYAVVELDPHLVDNSFVADRLEIDDQGLETLANQISEHGQQVPILVRPHPDHAGRYQVAFGHRRLAAVKRIGIQVRAVVRELKDEELVISQGQENNARQDLSYIERSFFAFRLENRGFNRDVIMSALGVDKAALSRMIALAGRLTGELIEAIGPAPGFGRTRWAELAELLDDRKSKVKMADAIAAQSFKAMSSDERFQAVYDLLRKVPAKPRAAVWRGGDGRKLVRISETGQKLNLTFDKNLDEGFGAFVEARLATLFEEYARQNMQEK